ncbi:MAG: proton-conducting transporter membrane subunit [Pirellulaceae bacterium]
MITGELHFPWIEASILIPLAGAAAVSRIKDAETAQRWSSVISAIALLFVLGEWMDYATLTTPQADDHWHLITRVFGRDLFVLDEISAPLTSLAAILYFLTIVTTLKTKIRRFSFVGTLISESVVLATFSCKNQWGVIALLAAGTIYPYWELRDRRRPTRVYLLHMATFIGLMVIGATFAEREGLNLAKEHSLWAIFPILLAVLIRCGIAPFHCWVTDLFENASFGTAVLFVTPITGAYAAIRLLLPIAPEWVLYSMGRISLITAVYAAGMSLIQKDARRFFVYLFLSHSAIVLVGLELVSPSEQTPWVSTIGITGALCVWLSSGLSLAGLGLTLRALESRCGRLSLTDFQGRYEHTPNLAMFFILTGLASVGFPGTLGFVGAELLVDSTVEAYPYTGIAVVIAAALNGIAVVQTYFLLFTGKQYTSSVSLKIHVRERYAVLGLAALILIGGLIPQPNIAYRNKAALELQRETRHQAEDDIKSVKEGKKAPGH